MNILQLMSSISLGPHVVGDIEFYLAFISGQMLFLLKRAGSSFRSGKIKNRWTFYTSNLDTIAIRLVIEGIFFYYPFRHYSVAQILKLFGWDITGSSNPWLDFLVTVPSSAISAIALGYAADSFLDGLSMWKRLPQPVRDWIAENVPELPEENKKEGEGQAPKLPTN